MRVPAAGRGVAVAIAIGAALLLAFAPPRAETEEDPPNPRSVGLVERAETRLAQIDVTVLGPPDVIGTLGAEDFRVKIHLRRLEQFKLDRLCSLGDADGGSLPPTAEPAASSETGPALPVAAASPVTYMFYLDQPHLTLAGRQRAIDVARLMIERLVSGGRRAMIVSNAARLKLVHPLSDDRASLARALDALENDREQWDSFAEQEKVRIDEVVRLLNRDEDVQRATALARLYQKEERWRTEQNLRRLEMALGRLSEIETPKAVVYFADTMRSNPGEHYMSFFGAAMRSSEPTVTVMSSDSLTARNAFDKVVTAASAQGIRFYTVEAQGLTSQFDLSHLNPKAYSETGAVSSSSRVRASDAQRALADMAVETGGRVFLHGVRGPRIVTRILDDFACRYLISFDPSRYREDVPYRVKVEIDRPGVEARARGQIVFPSESSRLTARLSHAFGSAGTLDDAFAVRIGLVPIGFEDGAYRALLQVSVPGTPLPGAAWDLGATVLAGNEILEEVSGHIEVSAPGVRVVLEREIDLAPGEREIVSVAHESGTGLVASEELVVDWPAPSEERVALSPIALVQPTRGAFLRDEQSRLRGSLAQGATDPTRIEHPAALIGLVCHSRRQKGQLVVERSLVGRSARTFPPLTLDLDEDRCAQFRDLLPRGSLVPGYYRYEVRVLEEGTLVQERSREFYAVSEAPAGAPPPAREAPLPPGNPAASEPGDGG
jgi:VWFA-related protein